MLPSPRIAACAAFAAALVAVRTAPAEDAHTPRSKHCLDDDRPKVFLGHTLAGQINPLGSEHHLVLTLCFPFVREPGLPFEGSRLEVGAANYLSPTYDHQGAFISLTPFAFLRLRVEATGIHVWTLPINGAGYYAFQSYDDDYSDEVRTQDRARQAGGFAFAGSARLQARIGPAEGLNVVIVNTFLAEAWSLGDGPYFYNLRRDILLAREDWVFKNTAVSFVQIPITANVATRLGVTDDTVVVPVSGRTGNIVAGLATLLIRRVGATIRELQPFLRIGVHTHHGSANGFRVGEANGLGGVTATYDIATIKGPEG